MLGGLFLAGSAAAQGSAMEKDVVEAVNSTRSTVTIAGEVFSVTSSSSLVGANGMSIQLYELRAGNGSNASGDLVEFQARRPSSGGSLREIRSLRVLDESYE
jgi:hypothetical protein